MKVTGYLVSAEISPLLEIISREMLFNKKKLLELLSRQDSAVGISRLKQETAVRIKKLNEIKNAF